MKMMVASHDSSERPFAATVLRTRFFLLLLFVVFASSSLAATGDENWDDRFAPLGSGLGFAIAVSGSNVYAGGSILSFADVNIIGIARWNGRSWSALGTGLSNSAGMFNATVRAITISGSNIYVGGDFTIAGGLTVNRIAKWDGNNWSALGSGIGNSLNDRVYAIAVDGNDVYVGGTFTNAGGVIATNIAKWNGSSWSDLGGAIHESTAASVTALAVGVGGELYAGGFFTSIGGTSVNSLAKWNGSGWSDVGGSMGGFQPVVRALLLEGGDLYAGGTFKVVGGMSITNLARWNGSSWSGFGTTVGTSIQTVTVIGSNIYVGGGSILAGGFSASGVARWDGSSWSALGTGVEGLVYTMAVSGGALYVGGRFTMAGGVPAIRMARWDGSNWSALGSGMGPDPNLDHAPQAMAASGADIYVGGDFQKAGGRPSYYFGIWHRPRLQASINILPGGQLSINWTSETGTSYQVLFTTDLSQPFAPLSGTIPSGGANTSYVAASPSGTDRFFRIVEVP